MQFLFAVGLALSLAQSAFAAVAFTSFPDPSNKVGETRTLTYSASVISSVSNSTRVCCRLLATIASED